MYVKRDAQGRIEATSRDAREGFDELVVPGSPELAAFLNSAGTRGRLALTDLELVRVLEDLIDVLVEKDVIHFTDLPDAAQQKLLNRRHTRVTMRKGLNLLDDEEEGGLV